MCGITGFFDFKNKSDQQILNKMTNCLNHRGPDDKGMFFKTFDTGTLGLGQTRLSILDISESGHQPMFFDNLAIIFNGEIYNFREVRRELEGKGYSFHSNSDTEVLLKSYHFWGKECTSKFVGMFAFAVFDIKKQILFIARDRAGIKPLYYYWRDDVLLFASELKAFHKSPLFTPEIDTDSLNLFIQYGYVPTPYSIYLNASKLKPGHTLTLDIFKQDIAVEKYWDVYDYYNKPALDITYDEALDEVEKLMTSAFDYRMVSDVSVGVFLSGGFDSSAVTSILQANRSEKIRTFTIGFKENNFDEAVYAKKVSEHLGTEHTEYYCTAKEAFDIIPKLPEIYDEPFGDNSTIPTILVSQLARQHVKVALSADGGDEIFGGYPKFRMAKNYTSVLPRELLKFVGTLMKYFSPEHLPSKLKTYNFNTRYQKLQQIWENGDPAFAMKMISQFISDKEISAYLNTTHHLTHTYFDSVEGLHNTDDVYNKLLAIDYKTFLLDNNLTKIDRATMSVGLEGRDPLIDHRLIEFVARLPSDFKIRKGDNKVILKDIVYKYIPQELMNRPKMGFVAPIHSWFRKDLREMLLYYLDEKKIKEDGFFNPEPIIKMRDNFLRGGNDKFQKLWHFMTFQLWLEHWKN